MILESAYTLVDDAPSADEAWQLLDHASVLGVDIETSGLDPREERIRLLQVSDGETTVLFDLFAIGDPPEGFFDALEDPETVIVCHNAKFELSFFFENYDVEARNVYDTMLAALLLKEVESASLENVAYYYTRTILEKEEQTSDWSQPLTPAQLEYAARDAAILLPLRNKLRRRMAREKMQRVSALEMEVVPVVARMELAGVSIDEERLERLGDRLLVLQEKAAVRFQEMLPGHAEIDENLFGEKLSDLNLNSPAQVIEAFESMGVELPNTKDATLAEVENEAAVPMREYRKHNKRLTAFAWKYPDHVHEKTGRIHASFQQLRVTTGRFSCTKPNLQQVPKEQDFRSCFIAGSGNLLITADYSQIELRIIAELSGDEALLEAFNTGKDLHSFTYSQMMGVPIDEVTKNQRDKGKILNFGTMYGQHFKTLAGSLGIPEGEAKALHEDFFGTYSGVKGWIRRSGDRGLRHGMVRTLSGRKISLDAPSKGGQRRQAVNFQIQGSSADITKRAMAALDRPLRDEGAFLVNCVHDELVIETPEYPARDVVAPLVERAMKEAAEELLPNVPVEVEYEVSKCWTK